MRACGVLLFAAVLPASAAAEPPDHVDLATERSRTVGLVLSTSADHGVSGFELSSARTWSALGIRTGGLHEIYRTGDGRRVHAGGWHASLRVSLVPFMTLSTETTARWWRFADLYVEVGGLAGLARIAGERRFRGDLWVGPGLDLRLGLARLRRLPVLSVRYLFRAGRWPRGSPAHTVIVGLGIGRVGQSRLDL